MSETVKSAERALRVVSLLAQYPDGLTYTEIVQQLRLPKSSAHALLATVVESGFIDLDEESRLYRLGIKAFEVGQAWLHARDLVDRALPYLGRVRDELNETCQLSILDGVDNVYLAKAEADQVLALQSNVGDRLPAYATGLGKVLLAGLDDGQLSIRLEGMELQRFTETTVASKEALLDTLAEVRLRGYSTDRGEYTPGVSCVAVPVRDHLGRTTAAISVSVPDSRRTKDWEKQVKKALDRAALDLSRDLGFPG